MVKQLKLFLRYLLVGPTPMMMGPKQTPCQDKTYKLHHSLSGHNTIITCLAFNSAFSYLASSASDGSLYLWDISSQKRLHQFEGPQSLVTSISFSPNNQQLAAITKDGHGYIWDLKSRACLQEFHLQGHAYCAVLFSNDGLKLGLDTTDHMVYIWDIKTKKIIEAHQDYLSQQKTVVYSEDFEFKASCASNHTINIYKTN